MHRYDYYCKQINFFHDLFDKAKKENKVIVFTIKEEETESGSDGEIVLVDKNICFDIDGFEIVTGGCGGCKNIYNNIYFFGTLYEDSKSFKYSGNMKSYYIMCKCDITEDAWNNFKINDLPYGIATDLLFDVFIERPYSYLLNRFINDNTQFILIDKNHFTSH